MSISNFNIWKFLSVFMGSLLFASHLSMPTYASDACVTTAIEAGANVTVSDGSQFKVRTYFHTDNEAAITHIQDKITTIAVEGPNAWIRDNGQSSLGTEQEKAFALGHQFHALLLNFDQIMLDIGLVENILFQGRVYSAKKGRYPFGGEAFLILGENHQTPIGLRLAFPESSPIDISFSNWVTITQHRLPMHIKINDGKRTFDYNYTSVSLTPKTPLWYYKSLPSPKIDTIDIYRLHRKLLAAHCLGDAQMLADLSTDHITIANRGELHIVTKQDVLTRFTSVFKRLNYTEYHDLKYPIIDVSESSDIGWIIVNPRAVGYDKASGKPFDDQWAWVTMVKKIDGRWLSTGNASNISE